jgi:hypothetical protein
LTKLNDLIGKLGGGKDKQTDTANDLSMTTALDFPKSSNNGTSGT